MEDIAIRRQLIVSTIEDQWPKLRHAKMDWKGLETIMRTILALYRDTPHEDAEAAHNCMHLMDDAIAAFTGRGNVLSPDEAVPDTDKTLNASVMGPSCGTAQGTYRPRAQGTYRPRRRLPKRIRLISAKDHPTLLRLMAAKAVRYDADSRCFVGLASDGQEVNLGDDMSQVEHYLTNRPTPDQW